MAKNLMHALQYNNYGRASDVAGEVVKVGPGVTNYKVGDKVVSLLDHLYHNPKAFYLLMLVVFSFSYVFDGQPPDLKKQELVTQRGLMLLRICKKPWRYFFLVTHGVISKVFFCCLTTTE
ncbi:hypothetical protein ERO13_D04G090365v2, partial [Gossypium hirsutum]